MFHLASSSRNKRRRAQSVDGDQDCEIGMNAVCARHVFSAQNAACAKVLCMDEKFKVKNNK